TAGSGTSEEALEVIGAAFHQRVELRIQHWISLLPIGAEKLDSELTAFRILEANDLSFGHLWRRYDDAVIDFIILDRNLLNISHVIGCRDFNGFALLAVIGANRGHLGRHNLASLIWLGLFLRSHTLAEILVQIRQNLGHLWAINNLKRESCCKSF